MKYALVNNELTQAGPDVPDDVPAVCTPWQRPKGSCTAATLYDCAGAVTRSFGGMSQAHR